MYGLFGGKLELVDQARNCAGLHVLKLDKIGLFKWEQHLKFWLWLGGLERIFKGEKLKGRIYKHFP